MKIIRLFAALSLLAGSVFAQSLDRRALDTNAFYTTIVNAQNPNGGGVASKYWTNSVGTLTTPTNYHIFVDHLATANNTAAEFDIDPFGVVTADNAYAIAGYNSMPPLGAVGVMNNIKGQVGIAGGVLQYSVTKTNGEASGVIGISETSHSLGIGVVGTSFGSDLATTNIGVVGSAQGSANTNVGGYFETRSAKSSASRQITGSALISDSGDTRNFIFRGRTNGSPVFNVRGDGSLYMGRNVGTDADFNLFDETLYLWMAAITASNDPPRLAIFLDAYDHLDSGNSIGAIDIVAKHHVDNPYAYISMSSRATNGTSRALQMGMDVSGANFPYILDVFTVPGFVDIFKIGQDGDLDVIKSLTYSWPTAYGGANSVLTMPAANGTLVWSNIPALVTNNQARIGPGTNDVIAKFNVVGGTNVGNSPLVSTKTNLVQQKPRMDGGNFNVASTNQIIGRETSGGDTNWLEFVAGSAGTSEAHHIRGMATGAASQRADILINDAVNIEPISNQLVGHPAGGIYPQTDAAQTCGTSSQRWIDVWASRMHGTTGLNTGPQFGTGVGGTGFGLTTDNTMLQFFRDTGLTAAFNKDRNSGQLILDIAGNYLGFGSGISNCVSYFINSAIVGLVQVGTNSAVAAPAAQGIIGAQGSGTDKGASDLRLVGGVSTGTGTNGNVRIQAAEKALATSSSLNTATTKDRIFVIADPIILTTNSATIVLNATIPTALRGFGGTVIAHTEIENGVDIATTDETFTISANRKGTTVVAGNPSAPITSTSTSGGSAAIVNTWSLVANAQSVDLKLACVTSGINSTNSTVRVTFIPNSSAVPVITHP